MSVSWSRVRPAERHACIIVVVSAALALVPGAVPAEGSRGEGILGQEHQLTPTELGEASLVELEYGDPAEGLDIVEPPEASTGGGAEVSHPLSIPPGRGRFEPNLALTYDSGGGNGWVGLGWDLSVGDVSVDTRWGVPRYDAGNETESYLLDGQALVPTAVRAVVPRVANRADFTPRVDSEHELITRHGTSPKNYWWEVRDKDGSIRWYGGYPDAGGPVGGGTEAYPSNKRDPNAILTDEDGNAYRWALSAERDVGVNTIRYFYETCWTGVPFNRDEEPTCGDHTVGAPSAANRVYGKQLYLKKIHYTGAADASGEPEDPAYEVRFLRDWDLEPDPRPAGRRDAIVSARGGFLEVTGELLRRVEVWHGEPKTDGSLRNFDILSRRYDLHYEQKAFGKQLLTKVEQRGSDGVSYGEHTFDYHDELGTGGGFATAQPWSAGGDGDDLGRTLLFEKIELSALGSTETNAADVHAYFGFNPGPNPTKTGSFGGSVTIKADGSEAIVEFLDINGDLLPDKIWRTPSGVFYRLNTKGSQTFSDRSTAKIDGLSQLSRETSFGISGGPEIWFGINGQLSIGGDVSIGDQYFADVNSDGLPDFVSSDTVYFNRLVPSGGMMVPKFEQSSAGTKVPIETGTGAALPALPELQRVEQVLRGQSPLQDTLRRWVAPFDGSVRIDAPVTFTPTGPSPDGVRVAIQKNPTTPPGDAELWSATLTTDGQTATPALGSVPVTKGTRLYFRVGSRDNGANDEVLWDPKITYEGHTSPVPDANGLDQVAYQASDDFTLAGRPGTKANMPSKGRVRFAGTLKKTAATTDDITLLVLKNGTPILTRTISAATINAGGLEVSGDFNVAAPSDSDDDDDQPDIFDEVEVRVAVDSPIDVTKVELRHRLFYVDLAPLPDGTDPDGEELPRADETDPDLVDLNGEAVLDEVTHHPLFDATAPSDIDIYPDTTRTTGPAAAWGSDMDRDVTVRTTFTFKSLPDPQPEDRSADAVITVKSDGTRLAKEPQSINLRRTSQLEHELSFDLDDDEDYWFEISVRDPVLADRIASTAVQLRWTEGGTTHTQDVPSVRHSAGGQGVFPLAYRGWAYVGYKPEDDDPTAMIDETAFDVGAADFPDDPAPPSGVNDPNYVTPADTKSSPFRPVLFEVKDESGNTLSVLPAWQSIVAKANLLGTADLMRSSRTGVEEPSLGLGVGAGVTAVRRVGITAPALSIAGGVGVLGGSFGFGPSFGLLDYVDMNGDGFPDIVAPGYIQWTTPRGAFGEQDTGAGLPVINQDMTFAVGVGISGGGVEIKGNSSGDANTAQATKTSSTGASKSSGTTGNANQAENASEAGYGANVGGSFGVQFQWTNPNAQPAPDGDLDVGALGPTTAPLEIELADVNGDGLPDRVRMTPQGVFVDLNTGYGFSGTEIKWSDGGFENSESYAGSWGPTLGFSTPTRDFSGGIGFNESIDQARQSWVDVDGDGVLDQLRKGAGTSGPVSVDFGTGAGGTVSESAYDGDGDIADGTFDLVGGAVQIPTGDQIAMGRSRSVGGGFDFTFGIGPLCLPTPLCFIIISPGAHYERSISNNQVQLIDVNGDGAPDSVKSMADGTIDVALNLKGKTNLLKTVTNPLGGTFALDYERDGNMVEQPQSVWNLKSVVVDDGRDLAGDGADRLVSTYEYLGNRYDPLLRETLGYDTIVERQREWTAANPTGGQVRRTIERSFLNNSIFDSGLPTREALVNPDGNVVKESLMTWSLVDVVTDATADLAPRADDPRRPFDLSVAQRLDRLEQRWYASDGSVGQRTWSEYEYDELGNVVQERDEGEHETDADDTTLEIEWSTCVNGSSTDLQADFPCPAEKPAGRVSPHWFAEICPTWVSAPARMTLRDANGEIIRTREGANARCDNQSVTLLREQINPTAAPIGHANECTPGAADETCTELSYDEWGSYNRITSPENLDGERQRLDYVYDPSRHSDIAHTDDAYGKVVVYACADDPTQPCEDDDVGRSTATYYECPGDPTEPCAGDQTGVTGTSASPVYQCPDDLTAPCGDSTGSTSVTYYRCVLGPGAADDATGPCDADRVGVTGTAADPAYRCPDDPTEPCGDTVGSTSATYYGCPGDPTQPCAADSTGVSGEPGLTGTATFDGRTGHIASRTDANGQKTSYTYDAFGRILTITGPHEQGTSHETVEFTYGRNAAGVPFATAAHFDTTRPDDPIETVVLMDGVGREVQTKRDGTLHTGEDTPAEDVMILSGRIAYDHLGRPASETYPTSEALGQPTAFNPASSPQVTTSTWDTSDRLTATVFPDGSASTTTYDFDAAGGAATLFRTTTTDARSKAVASYSDVRDQVRVVDEGPDSTGVGMPAIRTGYGYDAAGQLVEVTDNGGNVTTIEYDLLGRQTAVDTPDGGLVEQEWDPAGNLVALITPTLRAKSERITYAYDFEHLTGVDYPETQLAKRGSPPAFLPSPDVTYVWGAKGAAGNGAGRVVRVEDGARYQDLTYDRLGAIASEIATMRSTHLTPLTLAEYTFETSFRYDGLGRLLGVTYPDGEQLSNTFDAGGLLNGIKGTWSGGDVQYLRRLEYDEFNYRAFQETGNGVTTEYTRDPNTRRLERQVTTTPVRIVQDLNYEYDLVGNVERYDNNTPVPGSDLMGGSSTQVYGYDPFYRLTSADGTYNYPPTKRREYSWDASYDALGNVTAKSQRDEDFSTPTGGKGIVVKPTTYSFDPIRYVPGRHQISQIGSVAYKYDADGSFLGTQVGGKWQRSVVWDAARRARIIGDTGSTTDYTYDESGRLAIERGKSAETLYVNRWYTVRSGNITKHIWADGDRLATQQVLDPTERRNYYLHKDLQGSTNAVTDDGALLFQHLEYFPSGERWIVEESNQYRTPYLFGGAYWEENRRLTDLGERWYEPREMFLYSPEPILSEDPAQVIDDPALLPAYTYAQSNPLRLYDPDGRDAASVLGIPASSVKTGGPSGITLPGPHRTAGFRFDDDVVSIMQALKDSRLKSWQFDLAVSTRADRIQKISEAFEGRALVTIDVGEISGSGPKAIGRLFAGLASIKEVKFGLPFHKGRFKYETKAGLKTAAQKAIAENAAQATAGPSAGTTAAGGGGGSAGAPRKVPKPLPKPPAKSNSPPVATGSK